MAKKKTPSVKKTAKKAASKKKTTSKKNTSKTPTLIERSSAAAAQRNQRKGEDALAMIDRRLQQIAESFYDIALQLQILQRKEIYVALGAAFREGDPRYSRAGLHRRGDTLKSVILEGLAIPLQEIFVYRR